MLTFSHSRLSGLVACAAAIAAIAGAAAAAKPVSISCVGDSITVADGNLSYPLQLGRLLGAGYNVTN